MSNTLTPENWPDAHLQVLAEASDSIACVARLGYSTANMDALITLRGEFNQAYSLLVAHEPKAPAPTNPRPWYEVLQVASTADLSEIRSAYWQLAGATTDTTRLAELRQAYDDAQPQPEVAQGLPV